MQNNKWTHNEEKDLVFKLRGGSQMKDIAESSGRSYGAIKERLKKIIYENIKNINNTDEVQKVAKYLNLDSKLVEKYYRAYVSRLIDQQQEQPKQEQPKQEQPKQEQPKQEQPKQEQPKQEQPKQEQPKQEPIKQELINQTGGTNMTIKRQNEMLEDIIKNHDLKKKIGQLVKTKQLDKDSKDVLKKLLFNIKN
jgi:hypothetical protein